MRTRRAIVVRSVLLLALALGLALLRWVVYRAPSAGSTVEWGWPSADVARFRATAIAVAATVGAALALSGVLLQSILRNPLASPFVLGVSSGAALGVMTGTWLGHTLGGWWGGPGMESLLALVGGLGTLAVVYALGQRRGWLDPLAVLLVGVVIAAVCGALVMGMQHLVPEGLRDDLVTWMMGTIRQDVDPALLIAAGAAVLVAVAVASWRGPALDVATLSDDEARTLGLAVGPLRLVAFGAAGVLTSVAVAIAGPIGFVGLIAPHAARGLLGARHRGLAVGAALLGASLLVGGDLFAQVVPIGGGRLPVGVFTALVGGPMFIVLLRAHPRPGVGE